MQLYSTLRHVAEQLEASLCFHTWRRSDSISYHRSSWAKSSMSRSRSSLLQGKSYFLYELAEKHLISFSSRSFLFGYDSGVMTDVIASKNFLKYFNTTNTSAIIGAINSTFNGGAVFGSLMGGSSILIYSPRTCHHYSLPKILLILLNSTSPGSNQTLTKQASPWIPSVEKRPSKSEP